MWHTGTYCTSKSYYDSTSFYIFILFLKFHFLNPFFFIPNKRGKSTSSTFSNMKFHTQLTMIFFQNKVMDANKKRTLILHKFNFLIKEIQRTYICSYQNQYFHYFSQQYKSGTVTSLNVLTQTTATLHSLSGRDSPKVKKFFFYLLLSFQ